MPQASSLRSPKAQLHVTKNRDAILAASCFVELSCDYLIVLMADDRVVREVQVIGVGAIEVDPTLDCI